MTGRQLPKHDTQREDVGRAIHVVLRADLLRRHVCELAFERPGARLREPIGNLRDPEIDDLRVAVVSEEEVVRRDVSMDETEQLPALSTKLVSRVKALRRIGANARRKVGRDELPVFLASAHDLTKRLAVEVFHRDPIGVVVLPEVEHLRHVRVVDPRRDTRLVEEHVDELVVLDEVRVDALDRDPLLEPARPIHPGEMDARHAADADLFDDAISTKEERPDRLLGSGRPIARGGQGRACRGSCGGGTRWLGSHVAPA